MATQQKKQDDALSTREINQAPICKTIDANKKKAPAGLSEWDFMLQISRSMAIRNLAAKQETQADAVSSIAS